MKRILFVFLIIATSVFAQFAGGNGTSGNPYQIATALQLDSVRNHLTNYYVLNNDIDLSSYANWIPIGAQTNGAFSGNFNGRGYSILNLKITSLYYNVASSSSRAGLFWQINYTSVTDTVVRNLTIKNFNITINDNGTGISLFYPVQIGVLAGNVLFSSTNKLMSIKIKQGIINVTLNNIYDNLYFANLAPFLSANRPTVLYCSAINDTISVFVSASNPQPHVGALTVSSPSLVDINQCFVEKVKLTSNRNYSYMSGLTDRGGVQNSYAIISISSIGLNSQGLASIDGTTNNSYSVPTRLNQSLSGFCDYYTNSVSSCYYDSTVFSSATDALQGGMTPRAVPKSTSDMKTQTTYVGWDFTNIWKIDPLINSGYPYLRNNPPDITLAIKRLRVRR